jgi:hypothetical protein
MARRTAAEETEENGLAAKIGKGALSARSIGKNK